MAGVKPVPMGPLAFTLGDLLATGGLDRGLPDPLLRVHPRETDRARSPGHTVTPKGDGARVPCWHGPGVECAGPASAGPMVGGRAERGSSGSGAEVRC